MTAQFVESAALSILYEQRMLYLPGAILAERRLEGYWAMQILHVRPKPSEREQVVYRALTLPSLLAAVGPNPPRVAWRIQAISKATKALERQSTIKARLPLTSRPLNEPILACKQLSSCFSFSIQ